MNLFGNLIELKKSFQLPCPGSLEHLHKECRNVTTLQQFFEGGKADLAKGLSPNFQVSHSFTLAAGQSNPYNSVHAKSAYHFGALYATERHLLHGMIGDDGTVQGKYHYNPSKETSLRMHHQISPSQPAYDMMQLELDHVGQDYSLNCKAFNPSPTLAGKRLGLSGIFTVGFLHSIGKGMAVGMEMIYQRINPKEQDVGVSLSTKFWDSRRILTLTLQQLALLQASYWHKVNEKIELGTELQASLFGKLDGVATVACKLDYKQATVRGQLDTTGKVALVLEEKLAPGFSFLVCGEIDHLKGGNKFGVGINMES